MPTIVFGISTRSNPYGIFVFCRWRARTGTIGPTFPPMKREILRPVRRFPKSIYAQVRTQTGLDFLDETFN